MTKYQKLSEKSNSEDSFGNLRQVDEPVVAVLAQEEKISNKDEFNVYKENLEELVEARTEKLIDANEKLKSEIAEKRKTEAKLREEKNKFQMYLDIAAIMIVVLDKSGNVKLINKKGCKILGFKEHEILEKNWFDNFIPDEEKLIVRNVQFSVLNKNIDKYETFENYVLTKSGQKRLISWNNSVLYDSAGEIISTISSGEDITEKREAEEIIKRMNFELEEKVRERTEELEMLNKDLESFSYSISHDLRAPLRHIQGFSELLKQHISDKDSQLSKYISMILNSSNEMGIMIEKLLEFSKFGRKVLKKSQLDLNSILNDILISIEEDTKNRVIVWDIQNLPKITGDEHLIKIALSNLISNAVKYTSKRDSARIEIGFYPKASGNVIYVKDNGAGFDMNFSEKLFGVFQRLHGAEEFDGTGIGLAIVKRIVNKHGGQVWASGKQGKGATFYISLPYK